MMTRDKIEAASDATRKLTYSCLTADEHRDLVEAVAAALTAPVEAEPVAREPMKLTTLLAGEKPMKEFDWGDAAPHPSDPAMVLVPRAAIDWLMGEGPDPAGLWFGEFTEDYPCPPGVFWWREQFRAILASAPGGNNGN